MAACNFFRKSAPFCAIQCVHTKQGGSEMSNTFEKKHLPVEEEQSKLNESHIPEVEEEEEDYDEPQPWMDEFEYIDWLISHR